jgi:hypothetical protein
VQRSGDVLIELFHGRGFECAVVAHSRDLAFAEVGFVRGNEFFYAVQQIPIPKLRGGLGASVGVYQMSFIP